VQAVRWSSHVLLFVLLLLRHGSLFVAGFTDAGDCSKIKEAEMKLSIALSALLITWFVAASTEKANAVVYCQYVEYPAGCIVKPGVVLRPRPVAGAVVAPGVGVRPVDRPVDRAVDRDIRR
jgi:hypothetical protein